MYKEEYEQTIGLGNYPQSQVEYLFLNYLVLIFSLKTLQRISNSALKILYVSSPVSIQHYKKQNGQKNTTPITVNILKLKTALSLSYSTIRANSIFNELFKTLRASGMLVFAFRIRFLAEQNTKLYYKYSAILNKKNYFAK